MKCKLGRYALVAVALAMSAAMPERAVASLVFTMTEKVDGGINVVGAGSGFSDRSMAIGSFDWDVQDFETDFLLDSVSVGFKSAATVSGTLKNLTTNTTVSIISFRINRNSTSEDDLDFGTSANINFSFGDEYAIDIMAMFSPSTVAFSSLIPGSHRDVGRTIDPDANNHGPLAEEIWGVTTVNVAVPEASSLCFGAIGLVSCAAARCLRKRTA